MNYSKEQIDCAKREIEMMNAGDSYAFQADPNFLESQAILLLQEKGEIPLGMTTIDTGISEPDHFMDALNQTTMDLSNNLAAKSQFSADESGLADFDAGIHNMPTLKGPLGIPGINPQTGEIMVDFPLSTAFQKPLPPKAQDYLDGTIKPITPITVTPNDGRARASGEAAYKYKYHGPDHISARDKYIQQFKTLNYGQMPNVFAPGSDLNDTSYYTGKPTPQSVKAQNRNEEIARLRMLPDRNIAQEQRLAELELKGMQHQIKPTEHLVNKISKPWSQNPADLVAGQGLNIMANNSVDSSRMGRLNYYQNHSYTEALNQFPHSSPAQFKAMHDFYSDDPARKQAMVNRAISPNLGEEQRTYAAQKYSEIAHGDPISPHYNNNRFLNLPGKVSSMVADQAYNIPTAAVTGRGVDANREALKMVEEYETLGQTSQQAARNARNYQMRNPFNYGEIMSVNPAGRMRKTVWSKIKDTVPVKSTMTAVENSRIDSMVSRRLDPDGKILSKFAIKTIENAANHQFNNKINNMHRDISGLPPELKEQAIMDLLEKSALGVLDDRIRTGVKGY